MNERMGRLDDDEDVAIDEPVEWHDIA